MFYSIIKNNSNSLIEIITYLFKQNTFLYYLSNKPGKTYEQFKNFRIKIQVYIILEKYKHTQKFLNLTALHIHVLYTF